MKKVKLMKNRSRPKLAKAVSPKAIKSGLFSSSNEENKSSNNNKKQATFADFLNKWLVKFRVLPKDPVEQNKKIKDIKFAMRQLHNASDTILQLEAKPSLVQKIGAASSIALDTTLNYLDDDPMENFFDTWQYHEPMYLVNLYYEVFKSLRDVDYIYNNAFNEDEFPRKRTSQSNVRIVIAKLPGNDELEIGWHEYAAESGNFAPDLEEFTFYYRNGAASKINDFVSKKAWKNIKNGIVLSPTPGGGYNLIPEASLLDSKKNIKTKRSDEIASELKHFQKANESRAVLIWGPTGTGKTTIIKQTAELLGGRYLRIPVKDLVDISNYQIAGVCNILKPEILVIDDLDRIAGINDLFEGLENFKLSLKFIFASMNNPSSLDPAIIRPGRFDMHVKVVEPDPDVVRQIIPDTDPNFDVVCKWPIAYIKEYEIRVRVLGHDKAQEYMDELQGRINDAENYENSTIYQKNLFKRIAEDFDD